MEKRTMEYNNSSYEWNYQDSMRNQIRKNKYPESNTIQWDARNPTYAMVLFNGL